MGSPLHPSAMPGLDAVERYSSETLLESPRLVASVEVEVEVGLDCLIGRLYFPQDRSKAPYLGWKLVAKILLGDVARVSLEKSKNSL